MNVKVSLDKGFFGRHVIRLWPLKFSGLYLYLYLCLTNEHAAAEGYVDILGH